MEVLRSQPIKSCVGITNYNWSTLAAIATAVGVLIVFSTPRRKETFNPDALPPINYNVDEVNAYWRWRPLAVAKRASVVASEVFKWALGALFGFVPPKGVSIVSKLDGRFRHFSKSGVR